MRVQQKTIQLSNGIQEPYHNKLDILGFRIKIATHSRGVTHDNISGVKIVMFANNNRILRAKTI